MERQAAMQFNSEQLIHPIEEAMRTLDVKRVFGDPVSRDDVTVIPVSEIQFALGYGMGGGEGTSETEEHRPARGSGSGGGGGIKGSASPVGQIVIKDGAARFEPIMNRQRVALASFLFSAWVVFWIGVTIRTVMKANARRR